MGLSRNHFQLNSGSSPVRSQLRPFPSRRVNSPFYDLDWPVPMRPTIARDAGGRWSVPASPRPGNVNVKPSGWSGHPPVTNVACNCIPSVRTSGVGIHPQSHAGLVENLHLVRRSAVVRIPAFRAGDRDGRNAATRGRNGIRNAVSGATRRRPRRRAGRRRQTWHRRWCPITEVVQIVAGLSQAARDWARQRGSILDYRCR